MGFNILIADDRGNDIVIAKNIVSKSHIGDYIDNIYTCQFIKTTYNCPLTEKPFIELITEINYLDIALVDLSWDDDLDYSNYSDGGKFIIQEILKKRYFHCLIIPLTKEIGENISPQDQTFFYRDNNDELMLESISKKSKFESQVTRFNNLFYTEWILHFVKKINNPKQLNSIKDNIQGKPNIHALEINDRIWDFNQLMSKIPERKKNLEDQINKLLGFTFPSGIFNWANPKKFRHSGGRPSKTGFSKPDPIDLVEVYKIYISLDIKDNFTKTNEIDKLSKSILFNRIERISNPNLAINHVERNVSKVEIFHLPHNCKDLSESKIPEEYFDLLLWRRIVLGWNRYANKSNLEAIKVNVRIFEDCYGKQFRGSNYGTLKNFFFFLGFNITKTGYIDPISLESTHCFPEENVWLSELEF